MFCCWSAVWAVTLLIPPGPKAINTAYRINFVHGVVSSVVAVMALYGVVPYPVATMATVAYFIVDFVNILINDFVHHAPSYQRPSARRVEYVHHILCCTVGVMSELMFDQFCTFERNPFVLLMFAELSTPFLIAWRYTQRPVLGILFAVTFLGCRIIYHGGFLIPECMRRCHYSVGYGFGVPYNLMNLFFLYQIVRKLISEAGGRKRGMEKTFAAKKDGTLSMKGEVVGSREKVL